jgi:hypothetical protein
MLAANAAIQGVIGPSKGGRIIASPAQIASSISLVYSIGSIITGLLLVRRNRTMARQNPATAVRWSFHILRFLADWLPVRLPGQHDVALLLPRALGRRIQPTVYSADVVVRRRIPGSTFSR